MTSSPHISQAVSSKLPSAVPKEIAEAVERVRALVQGEIDDLVAENKRLLEQLESLRQAEENARAQERVGNEGDADAIRRDALRRMFYGDSNPAKDSGA